MTHTSTADATELRTLATSSAVPTAAAYQEWVKSIAIYPQANTGSVTALSYVALGLVGEAGEIANKAKKLLRDGDTPALRDGLRDELGDVLWYLAQTASELGINLAELMAANQAKLESRRQRQTLQGSGDNR